MAALANPPTNTRLTIVPTPSGFIDTRYPDGNDGTPAIPLAWTTIDPISVLTTATSSVNLCTSYLTQPAPPNDIADLTVEAGYSLPTGFSLGGTHSCTLSWTTPSATSTAVRIRASISGLSPAISAEFSIVVTAPPSGDMTAPTVPTRLLATNGVGQVDLSWDASSDAYTTTAGTGLQDYQVEHSVDGVRTVSASGGVQPQLALTNVGTLSPTPTASQNGSAWTITSAGTIDGAASAFGLVNAQVSGNACLTGRIDSVVTSVNNTKFGIMVADSTSAGSRFLAAYVLKQANGSLTYQVRRRQTDGANAGSLTSFTITALPYWAQICETASGVFDVRHSADGITWSADQTAYSLPMSTTKPWGVFGTATTGSGGATATGTISELNLSTQARVSYTYSTTHAGTVRVRARDTVPNASSYSLTIPVAPEPLPVTTTIKYHPGHYTWLGPTISNFNLSTGTSSQKTKLGTFCSNTNIQGIMLMPYWAVLETGTAGVYNDSYLDDMLTSAKNCNKRVMLRIGERIFGGYSNIGTYYFPNYLNATAYNGGWVESGSSTWSGNLKASTRLWEAPVMDRLIALSKHICQRYEADTNIGPYFEMLSLEEVTLGVPTSLGFSAPAMVTQFKRWMDQVRTACPRTGLRLQLNYTGVSTPETVALIQYAVDRDIAIGGPDPELPLPLPTLNGTNRPRTITGNELMRGNTQVTCGSNTCWLAGGGTDFRNSGVWVAEQQEFGLGGQQGYVETGQEVFDYQVGTMRARYIVWLYYDYSSTGYSSPNAWSQTILPAINTNLGKTSNNSGVATAPASVPCLYAAGCNRN